MWWVAWIRKQRFESAIPTELSAVLDCIVAFTDPPISRQLIDLGSRAAGSLIDEPLGAIGVALAPLLQP